MQILDLVSSADIFLYRVVPFCSFVIPPVMYICFLLGIFLHVFLCAHVICNVVEVKEVGYALVPVASLPSDS